MRTLVFAALTLALASAPAWAHGANVSIQTGVTPVYHGGSVVIEHGHGHGHGHKHGQHCRWVPGHYETYYRQVWVPGRYETRWVDPVYRKQLYNGVAYTVCVSEGYYTNVWVPGHYTTVTERRWCEGYWTCRHR